MTPEQFTVKLKSILSDNLLSVVLYGSGAVDDQTKKYSNFNLLVILKEETHAVLQSLLPIVSAWIKSGNPAPVVFSEKRFAASHDIFPIEFLDMKENHRVLWGGDPLEKLFIGGVPLRLQLERELQTKLLLLQQKFLETGGKPDSLRGILAQALSSCTVLLKSVLRLNGKNAPAKKQEAWKAVAGVISIDVDAMEVIYQLRQGNKEALKHAPDDLFVRLERNLKAALDYVNAFPISKN